MRIAEALLAAALLASQQVLAEAPRASLLGADLPGANLLGEWMTEDRRGVVRIEPCGAAFCGRVVGISDFPPGGLRDLHGTPQCGLVIIHDLRPAEDGRRRGSITNPDDGRTYGALLWVAADGSMRLRGYLGLPILGSTQTWPRFTGTLTVDCHIRS